MVYFSIIILVYFSIIIYRQKELRKSLHIQCLNYMGFLMILLIIVKMLRILLIVPILWIAKSKLEAFGSAIMAIRFHENEIWL